MKQGLKRKAQGYRTPPATAVHANNADQDEQEEEEEEDCGCVVADRRGRQRSLADVELRLQEAMERGTHVLYLNNHSIHRLDSPLFVKVAEQLDTLHLNMNQLTSFPQTLLSFSKLQHLSLSRNAIAGPIPDGIGQLTALRTLILAYNRITSFPATVALMTSLQELHLEGNPTLLYMPAEILLNVRSHPTFMLKWNSIKDSKLTPEKLAEVERCEPVAVPSLLNLASGALLTFRRTNANKSLMKQLPQELEDYLLRTYVCWHCHRQCTGRPPFVVLRRIDLAPRQKPLDRRSLGYWGGEPTQTPCLFKFDRAGCYLAWHHQRAEATREGIN